MLGGKTPPPSLLFNSRVTEKLAFSHESDAIQSSFPLMKPLNLCTILSTNSDELLAPTTKDVGSIPTLLVV